MKTKKAIGSLVMVVASVLALGILSATADNHKTIPTTQLPASSQQFIKTYFPKEKVSLVMEERDFLETSYNVVLSNGAKIEFHKNGEWKEVDCRHGAVPSAIVPAQIASKVMDLYPDAAIVEIDKDSRDYEVKLSNGWELTFDLQFTLVKIDD